MSRHLRKQQHDRSRQISKPEPRSVNKRKKNILLYAFGFSNLFRCFAIIHHMRFSLLSPFTRMLKRIRNAWHLMCIIAAWGWTKRSSSARNVQKNQSARNGTPVVRLVIFPNLGCAFGPSNLTRLPFLRRCAAAYSREGISKQTHSTRDLFISNYSLNEHTNSVMCDNFYLHHY